MAAHEGCLADENGDAIVVGAEGLGARPFQWGGGGRVIAVAVTYQPDLVLFQRAVRACRCQVAHFLVIDNGSSKQCQDALMAICKDEACEFVPLLINLGVAVAQNHGIYLARRAEATHILLLDQDSVAAPDMVLRLFSVINGISHAGRRIAAVGPRLVDRRSGYTAPFIHFGLLRVKRLLCPKAPGVALETDFLVASGALIPVAVLDEIGLMEEGLFIDNVDLEWSFRARHRGFVLLGACDAVLSHSVGDQVLHVVGRALYRHGPLRQYYIMRNRILLYKRIYSPWGWIINDFFRMLVKVAIFGLVFSPRLKNLSMMMRGMWDGFCGRNGPFNG